MSDYRLHCVAESGNCYKVALMLNLCGCDWEPAFVDYFGGATRQDQYREGLNEFGEVPVLEHEGRRHTQSGAILTWLAEHMGQFGANDEAERLDILRWILFDNHKFTSYYATLRFMVGIQNAPEGPVTEFLRARVNTAFGIVEQQLSQQKFVTGERPTIADISMVAYLYYPERTGVDLGAYPRIQAWLQRIAALPGWKGPYELMPRERAGANRG